MEIGITLRTADRDTPIGIIVEQQATIAGLEKQVAQFEGRAKVKGGGHMPGLKPRG